MHTVVNPPRIGQTDADPLTGRVSYAPGKSLWLIGMTLAAVIGGAATFSWDALLLFLVFTAAVLLLGHSLGMHRKLIHDSYACPLWLEHFLVYCGVLVGMAGPYGMVRTHDLRDWAQRQRRCHPYLANARPALRDAWWQLHCEIRLAHPPALTLEPRIANDRFYRWLERTWQLQHLLVALALYAWGGWAYVFWGQCARVTAGVTGHWVVGYFAHNHGPRTWHVEGAAAQGHNVPIAALLTMGEAWHNNHHAYPGSARLGLHQGELDPGWWVLMLFKRLGLVWNIRLPQHLPVREELKRLPVAAHPPAREGQLSIAEQQADALFGWIKRTGDACGRTLLANRRIVIFWGYGLFYMLPFTLLFALGLAIFQPVTLWLALAYAPPLFALWIAVLRYPGFKVGAAPFDLGTRKGRGVIGLLAYGIVAVIASILLAYMPQWPNTGIFIFSGYIGLPAALFASMVLLKTWKERRSPV